jgi:hypothetical protein
MSYGSRHTETTATVKGGMPVYAKGECRWDEAGADVVDIELFWSNTGKPVTAKFEKSLSAKDWDNIADALWEAR